MGLGPVSKEMDERKGESRGLEGEQGDLERKTISPSHSKGLNPDKGLWLFPKARWLCVGRQAAEARSLLPAESPHLRRGLLPASGERLVLVLGQRAVVHLGFTSFQTGQAQAFLMQSWETRAGSWGLSLSCCSLLIQGMSHISSSFQEKRSRLG